MMEDAWREVTAEWKGELAFLGWNRKGGEVQMGMLDGKPGLTPMELLLAGVAGCTGMDIVDILKKKRQDLQSFQVKVRGKRVDTYPRIYDEIEILYLIWGNTIDPKAVEQAIQLSEEKYCSASAMLRSVANISSSYEIFSADVVEK